MPKRRKKSNRTGSGARLGARFQRMSLLNVLKELTREYPTLMLVDQTKPDEGAFRVGQIMRGIQFSLEQEEVDIDTRIFLETPHWFWGMESLGFVTIWALPDGKDIRLAFKEYEGGLPTNRPPFVSS